MAKARGFMKGLQMEAFQEELKSYVIGDTGSELKLRAYLFRDGVLYKDGAALATISPDDVLWETKQQVGHGVSGLVYFVLHKTTQEPLALKEIPINTKTHRDEVSAELAVLAKGIDNPHVIRHFGAFWNAESMRITLVMEWMAYSLEDLTKIFGRVDDATIRLIAVQLATGLKYLHDEKRVIHRDIKPSNLLINSQGEIKFGDFGISKVVETITIQPQSTSFVGTTMFMAPERLEEGEYTFVSDVWSLGLTLVACATGKAPWADDDEAQPSHDEEGGPPHTTVFQMLQRMASGAVPKFPANFPPDAHDFVGRCLERDPTKRATSAELCNHPFLASTSPEASRKELSALLSHVSQLTLRTSS